MIAIILRQSQLSALRSLRNNYIRSSRFSTWADFVDFYKQDYKPIRIRDDVTGQRYALNVSVWSHSDFSGLKRYIQANKATVLVIGELSANDFPSTDIETLVTDYSRL